MEEYDQFIGQVLRPDIYKTLKEPGIAHITVVHITATGKAETYEFDLYPFQTISDLCTNIYIESGERDEYHPENQCLLIPGTGPAATAGSAASLAPLQYVFRKEGRLLETINSPFTQTKPDPRFVDLAGATLTDNESRMNVLLEDVSEFKNPEAIATIYLFLYRDIYEAYVGIKPVNSIDWDGIFRIYFPQRAKAQEDGSLTSSAESYKKTLVQRLKCKQMMISHIDEHLSAGELRKPGESSRDSVNLSNIKNLRFNWKKPTYDRTKYAAFNIESLFYDMLVSDDVPYIRFYSTVPISKIHVQGVLNIPSLEKPEILIQWSTMPSPTPDEEVIMLKILIRPGSESLNPLYATMYIHEDGSAKFIVQPDANTKALTRSDLMDLSSKLRIISSSIRLAPIVAEMPPLEPLPIYSENTITLDDAYIVLSIWLDRDDKRPITKKSLDSVLPFYNSFFQVTKSPLEFQHPISFLRYKGVSNFQIPSRDFQFLHRVIDLQKLDGKTSIPQLVKYYKEAFDVPDSVAQGRVRQFLDNLTEYTIVDPVELEYKPAVNPGIDIAIFGKLPFYTIHLYRIDSIRSLRRIKTLLSLLISLDADEYEEIRKCLNNDDRKEEAAATMIVEQEEEEETTAVAYAAAGETGFVFDELGDFSGFGEDAASAAAAPPEVPLTTLAAAEAVEAEEEDTKDKEEDDDDEVIDATQLKQTRAKTYFLKRLDFYDRRLFQYTKSHPSLKKYSSMCAANALKQPIVMNEDEYIRMKETYLNDNVLWIDYPLPPKSKRPTIRADGKPMNDDTEIITTLRYGSSLLPGQANIYICSDLWCRKDEIVILKSDYVKLTDRKGKRKDKDTCPFCHDGPIKNRMEIVKGESVIVRSVRKPHLHPRFIGKRVHPEGLYLPCCFVTDKPIYSDDPTFKKPQAQVQGSLAIPQEQGFVANYNNKLANTKLWYVVGPEKLPLEILSDGPQIGILPPEVNTFFAQDRRARHLVINDHAVSGIVKTKEGKPNASGFLRIAAENRKAYQAESFLSAVAPFYDFNTAKEMKDHILKLVQPHIFIALNYGNFLFDFYNPSIKEPFPPVLKAFAIRLKSQGTGIHREALLRCWKAFHSFTKTMNDTTTQKDYRQFAQLFSTNIIGEPIQFIVLEVTKNGVEIRCPPYGVSNKKSNIAFLLHYPSGIWEPVIYTENDASQNISRSYMLFDREHEEKWPEIVKKRVIEYENICKSNGLGMHSSPGINPSTMIPLSVGLTLGNAEAILRDSYNHVSALIFNEGTVVLPVIDDGSITGLKIELDWQNTLADGPSVVEFYRKLTNPSYVISSIKQYTNFYTLELANGLLVPIKKPSAEFIASMVITKGQELPAMVDTRIAFGTSQYTEELDYKDFEEIYQHLRFTFANWYSVQSPTLKMEINSILFKDGRFNNTLSLYEKRQRIFIKLGNEVMSWLDASTPVSGRAASLKRVDCLTIRSADQCTNKCVWKNDSCRIHTPAEYQIGSKKVDAKVLMIKKLFEELIRFPLKRDELMKKDVSQYIRLDRAFVSGDQKVIPENTRDWAELLRFEWMKKGGDEPRYYEEFAATAPMPVVQPQVPQVSQVPQVQEAPAEAPAEAPVEAVEAPVEAVEAPVDAPVETPVEAVEEPIFVPNPVPELLAIQLDAILGKSKETKALTFYTTPSIFPVLEKLGVNMEDLIKQGQVEEEEKSIMTMKVCDFIALSLKHSICQIVVVKGEPTPTIFHITALIDKQKQDFFCFANVDDVFGILAKESPMIPVPYKDLPVRIKNPTDTKIKGNKVHKKTIEIPN